MHRILAALAAVVLLAGCAAGVDRDAVHQAVVAELIPDTIIASAADGDETAQDFIAFMHEQAAEVTASIVDDGVCDSGAYRAGLGGQPELTAALDAGCAALARQA